MLFSTYLKQIEDAIDNLLEKHKRYSEYDYLLAFRGENRDYGKTKLMPSLFRNSDYISKEKYLFELLGDYGFLGTSVDRNIDRAIEAQHYMAISRMLDISFSILPALYFACKSEDKTEDGYVYIFCFPEHYSPHSQFIEDFYTDILEDGERSIAYASNFKVISHSYSNERIKAQVGGFIFFPGNEYRSIHEVYYTKIKIHQADKEQLRQELDQIFHINEATLFPEKENLVPIIRKKFTKGIYSNKRITVEKEIESYFERIIYEIEILVENQEIENIELLRKLRKEESDLSYYIEHNVVDEQEKEALLKNIRKEFSFIKMKYDRRK